MNEIGGYIEFEEFKGEEYHKNAVALNCGRNCLAYILQARRISKIVLPYFLCDSVFEVCEKYNVNVRYYHIDNQFIPRDVLLSDDEWIYIVNYYGQLSSDTIYNMYNMYEHRVIVDQAQAFFEKPIEGVDTLYTCRKFFGVPDGAYLYTDAILPDIEIQDKSYNRMNFLMGRYECTASEFYSEYVANNEIFSGEAIKKMSKLTHNLLRGIDYENVIKRRNENFKYLEERLGTINQLKLKANNGAFMYPLYIENGAKVRKILLSKKIYIPILWPNVFDICDKNTLEYDMAENILPLPIDQRYNTEEMNKMVMEIFMAFKV